MRSGTNWVGNLLNLHPDIACSGEYHLHRLFEGFDRISNPKKQPYGILMGSQLRLQATRDFERLVRRLIELGCNTLEKPQATILGDRTPCLLNRIVIRNAKRIHIVRDGRDCLVSSTFHFLRMTGTEYPFEGFPEMQKVREEFQANPDMFKEHPEQLLTQESWVRLRIKRWSHRYRLDMKFAKRRKAQVFCTTYEKLHADTENIRAQMYEFLGADAQKAEGLTDQTTAGFEKENVLSHYRKGKVGDWEKYFTPQVRQWFVEEGGQALRDAGYEKDDSWAT